MSCLNEELKSLFIHVPKCAGSSMSDVEWNKGSGHLTISDFAETINLDEYFKWSFVRNPFDRMVSAYTTCKEVHHLTFEEVVKSIHENRPTNFNEPIKWRDVQDLGLGVKRIHFYPMSSLIKGAKMNFIGKFESLEGDWEKLCSILKVSNYLPRKNIYNKERLNYYTPELKKMVLEIYKSDFEEFNY